MITAPEIEMLIILCENKYVDFKKLHMKPSEFCKSILGYVKVKSPEFIADYFEDIDKLIFAILEYKHISDIKKNEFSLADLLK